MQTNICLVWRPSPEDLNDPYLKGRDAGSTNRNGINRGRITDKKDVTVNQLTHRSDVNRNRPAQKTQPLGKQAVSDQSTAASSKVNKVFFKEASSRPRQAPRPSKDLRKGLRSRTQERARGGPRNINFGRNNQLTKEPKKKEVFFSLEYIYKSNAMQNITLNFVNVHHSPFLIKSYLTIWKWDE